MMEGQKNIVIRVFLATFTIFLLSELVDTHASKPSMIISNYLKQIRKRKFQLSGRSSWLSKTRYQDPCPNEQKTMNTAHYLGLNASEYYICPKTVTVVSCRRSSLKLNHRGKYSCSGFIGDCVNLQTTIPVEVWDMVTSRARQDKLTYNVGCACHIPN